MISDPGFPRLTPDNHRITSPADIDYNCVAWAAQDTSHWWQPGVYWPVQSTKGDFGIEALRAAFHTLGYWDAIDGSLQPGTRKIALYGTDLSYTHAARQLSNGKWTSKLGRDVDIEHDDPYVVAGGVYGELAGFMERQAP